MLTKAIVEVLHDEIIYIVLEKEINVATNLPNFRVLGLSRDALSTIVVQECDPCPRWRNEEQGTNALNID